MGQIQPKWFAEGAHYSMIKNSCCPSCLLYACVLMNPVITTSKAVNEPEPESMYISYMYNLSSKLKRKLTLESKWNNPASACNVSALFTERQLVTEIF